MYAIAIIGDICSFIPGVNFVSTPITGLLLGIAGAGTKHSIYADNRIAGTLLTIIAELLPFVSGIPFWTLRVHFAKKEL